MTKNNIKTLSLFCGAGGIDQGLKEAGIKTKVAIDYDFDSCKTFKANHEETEVIHGLVEEYQESFQKFDLVVGGPPCQPFSRGNNKTRTMNPTHINTFWYIVEKTKPRFYFMENVEDSIKVCNRFNYLIDCSNYGVPQTRIRRIYTNISSPRAHKKIISVKEALRLPLKWRHISKTGFTYQNGKQISRSINLPGPTITTVNNFRLTTKPIFSKKYPYLKQQPFEQRILTNEECAILQGFSKDYKFFGSKSSIRRQIGNAVPPPLAKSFFDVL